MYKGTLINGQGIAVMRPDSDLRSQEYYINEVLLLVKLEHENLAQLLGYCNEGTTTFVVYEFAPYASLNHSKVDMLTRLDLDLRYKIILAIARVLLYLHKNAPIRIIHGDVNPGNIYLDENMNPKLLGFGFARCLAINEADGIDANVVCGTCSCMAPEYAFGGRLSTKVDVFSFGALVLQTITGCRRYPEANENFMEYAWTDWCKATYFDIIDPKIDVDSCLVKTFIDIGLLCVQADAEQRPTMEEVVGMLLRATFDTPPIPRNTMSPQIIEADSHCTNAPNILPSNDYDSGAVEEFISELQPR